VSRVTQVLEELIKAITEEAVGVAVNRALSEHARRSVAGAQALTGRSAAKLAGVRRSTLTAALEAGALAGIKVGRRWSTTANAVEAWVQSGKPIYKKTVA
jgi:excisionase family DNA binding protein